jgi:hypothetical protein
MELGGRVELCIRRIGCKQVALLKLSYIPSRRVSMLGPGLEARAGKSMCWKPGKWRALSSEQTESQ